MNWDDKGYLLLKNKFKENAVIAEFFTENHGKTTGVIFGSTSKKIKNYLFQGNKFHINYSSKNDGMTGYFKVEIEKVLTPIYLDNNKKLSCIIYAMNFLRLLTVENQSNKKIYFLIDELFKILESNNWIKEFIFWELDVLKNLGYDLNLENYVDNKSINGIETYVVKNNNVVVPTFLINKEKNPNNLNDLLNGIKLVGDFLDKSILKPNNINFPSSRNEFVNLIKQ